MNEQGQCWNQSPAINLMGERLTQALCELPHGHGGAHQFTDDPTLPPMRWMEPLADVLAENERLRAVVARVEGLAAELAEPVFRAAMFVSEWDQGRQAGEDDERLRIASSLRDALSASSPSVEHRYTQTDGQAPAGRHEGAQGAGDGV